MFASTHKSLNNTSFSHCLSLALSNGLLNFYLADRSTTVLCSIQRYFPWGPGGSCYNLTLKINNKGSSGRLRDHTDLSGVPSSHQKSERSERAPSIFFMEYRKLKEVCMHMLTARLREQCCHISSAKGEEKGLDVNFKIKSCFWDQTLRTFLRATRRKCLR